MDDLEDFLPEPNHRRLVFWLCTPPKDRVPSTQQGIADELGVSPRTIRTWMVRDDVRRAWAKMSDDIIGDPGKVSEVLEALRSTALDPSHRQFTQAAKLYLEAVDAIKPPDKAVEIRLSMEQISEMSDDKLDAMVAEEIARLRAAEVLAVK
jgi:predicted transcriptional regulator